MISCKPLSKARARHIDPETRKFVWLVPTAASPRDNTSSEYPVFGQTSPHSRRGTPANSVRVPPALGAPESAKCMPTSPFRCTAWFFHAPPQIAPAPWKSVPVLAKLNSGTNTRTLHAHAPRDEMTHSPACNFQIRLKAHRPSCTTSELAGCGYAR